MTLVQKPAPVGEDLAAAVWSRG